MAIADNVTYFKALLLSKTTKSFSIVVVANALVTIIGFISSVLVLRSQSPELIATIYPLVGLYLFLDGVSDFGTSVSYVRNSAMDYSSSKTEFINTTNATIQVRIVINSIIVFSAILFSNTISIKLFNNPKYSNWIIATAICSWFYSIANFMQSILQVKAEFTRIAMARIYPNLVKAGILLFLVIFKKQDLHLLFIAFMISPLLSAIILLPKIDKEVFRATKQDREIFIRLFNFSKWIFISGIAVSCIGQIDIFMLRSMSSEQSIADYLGGQRLASALPILISSMVTILLPKISSYKNHDALRFYFKKAILVSPFIFAFIASISLIAPYAIPLTLGNKYNASIPIFQAYCWVYAIDTLITLPSLVFFNLNLINWFSSLNVVQLFCNYGLNLLLIPKYGALGVCISAGAVRLIGVPLVLLLAKREALFR